MKFDSKALRAAFNYQYYQKEPGAWAHNNKYIVQILYDSYWYDSYWSSDGGHELSPGVR